MEKVTLRGKTFYFNDNEWNLSNVVYKITTDRGGIYVGYTDACLCTRCDTHLINCEKELRRFHQSIHKECKVEVLYQCNGNSTQHLKFIENYTIFQEICKVLDSRGIVYDKDVNIFDFAEYFNDVILNLRFDVKKRELQYYLNNPKELHLDRYTPTKLSFSLVG